jgi:hypothetical protein
MIKSAHIVYISDLIIPEVPIHYRFTSSSLKRKEIIDCVEMCLRILFRSEQLRSLSRDLFPVSGFF